MAHEYRYYTADLLTDTIIAEVPLFGVYMEKMLNAAGNFTGTFVLDSGVGTEQFLIDGTIPGQCGIYVERGDECIWGGPIWSRTYQSSSKTVQLTAQTFESIFDHIVMTTDQTYVTTEQVTILTNWLTAMMAQTNNDFGITGNFPAATGVTRSIQMLASEHRFASEFLQGVALAENGLDFSINVDGPTSKTMKFTYAPTLVSSGLVFDYPGTLATYWYSESGSKGAVRSAAVGQGGYTVEATLSGSGSRPYFWQVAQYGDIGANGVSDIPLLQAKADALLRMPHINPTFDLLHDADVFDGWDKLGQTFVVNITDPRFPSGKTITSRLMGWQLSPQQSGTDESLKFVLESE